MQTAYMIFAHIFIRHCPITLSKWVRTVPVRPRKDND